MRLLFLGDSHAETFKWIEKLSLMPDDEPDVIFIAGATAQGISHIDSKTNALTLFKEHIASQPPYDYIFLLLGEVDCGYTIWQYADKYHETIQAQVENSLASYTSFVEWLKENTQAQIGLLGATLPTVKDGLNWKDEESRLSRKFISATQAERTALILEFNNRLKQIAQAHQCGYADITAQTMDKETGLVDSHYVCPDAFDHHLSFSRAVPLWVNEIKKLMRAEL